jgi:hypothetical protein
MIGVSPTAGAEGVTGVRGGDSGSGKVPVSERNRGRVAKYLSADPCLSGELSGACVRIGDGGSERGDIVTDGVPNVNVGSE